MKQNPTSTFLNGWRTARISTLRHAGLCIGRLQDRAIDHQVLREADRVRIVVRRPDLYKSIELLNDIAVPLVAKSPERPSQRVALQVMIGIPLGSVIGAMVGHFLQFDTIPWSVGGAIYVSAMLVAVSAPRR